MILSKVFNRSDMKELLIFMNKIGAGVISVCQSKSNDFTLFYWEKKYAD